MRSSLFDIGFCWVFAGTAPAEGLPRLRDYGYDGVELWPNALAEWGIPAWADALRAAELRCLQLCPYFDFMKGEASLARSRTMLAEFLDAAEILSCDRLRVFTGPPWGEGVVGAREATERQWADAIAGLREFCDIAAPRGVELCLECHEGSLMEDSPATKRLLAGVDRLNLTTNLQLPLRDESGETSLAALASTTSHVHIHNWTQGPGLGEMTYLEEGVFDWMPVVRELLAKGPGKLVLSVEHANHGGHHEPWETARRDAPFLRRMREFLERERA